MDETFVQFFLMDKETLGSGVDHNLKRKECVQRVVRRNLDNENVRCSILDSHACVSKVSEDAFFDSHAMQIVPTLPKDPRFQFDSEEACRRRDPCTSDQRFPLVMTYPYDHPIPSILMSTNDSFSTRCTSFWIHRDLYEPSVETYPKQTHKHTLYHRERRNPPS